MKKELAYKELLADIEKHNVFKPGSKLRKKYIKTWAREAAGKTDGKSVMKTKIVLKAKRHAEIEEKKLKRFDASRFGKQGSLNRKPAKIKKIEISKEREEQLRSEM